MSKKWVALFILTAILSFSFFQFRAHLNRHPITIEYPFPDWLANNQFLQQLDDRYMVTACFAWTVVWEKTTGNLYLVKHLPDNKIKVKRQSPRRLKWETLSQCEFDKRFTYENKWDRDK